MISEDIVCETLKQFSGISDARWQQAFDEMQSEQPYIATLLVAYCDMPQLNEAEKRRLHDMVIMVWHMMRQGPRPIRQVTQQDMLDMVQGMQENVHLLASDTKADFSSAIQTRFETCPEREILTQMLYIILEPDEPDPEAKVFSHIGHVIAGNCLLAEIDVLTKCQN